MQQRSAECCERSEAKSQLRRCSVLNFLIILPFMTCSTKLHLLFAFQPKLEMFSFLLRCVLHVTPKFAIIRNIFVSAREEFLIYIYLSIVYFTMLLVVHLL
jgi:hypothetical protein